MIEEPRLGALLMLWLAALTFTGIGWRTDIPDSLDWLRFVLRGFAVILAILAVMMTVDAFWGRAIRRAQSWNYAKTSHLVNLSKSLKGLTPRQTEIVTRYDPLSVEGLLGSDRVVEWFLRGERFSVPLGLVQDFLVASYPTSPRLFPIRRHPEFSREYNWTSAEDMLTEITRLLVNAGMAEYDRANASAVLIEGITWDILAEGFGVEKNWLS